MVFLTMMDPIYSGIVHALVLRFAHLAWLQCRATNALLLVINSQLVLLCYPTSLVLLTLLRLVERK